VLWFGLWANMHAGGCFLILIVLASIPVGESAAHFFQQRPTSSKRAWVFYLLCVLICAASPNFARGILHAMTLVQATGDTIGEWNAPIAYLTELEDPTISRIIAGLTPYLCALWIAALALGKKFTNKDLGRVAAVLAFSGLSLLYVRFVHFSVPIILILLPWTFNQKSKTHRTKHIAAGLAFIATIGMLVNTNIYRLFDGFEPAITQAATDLDERRFPIEAVEFLESAGFSGSIFCHARYGGYLRWHLGDKVQTITDGRSNVDAQTAHEILYVHSQHRTQAQNPEIAKKITAIYEKYDLDALVLETPAFTKTSLDCTHWTPVFRTPKLEIFYRNDATNSSNLKAVGRNAGDNTGCP